MSHVTTRAKVRAARHLVREYQARLDFAAYDMRAWGAPSECWLPIVRGIDQWFASALRQLQLPYKEAALEFRRIIAIERSVPITPVIDPIMGEIPVEVLAAEPTEAELHWGEIQRVLDPHILERSIQ